MAPAEEKNTIGDKTIAAGCAAYGIDKKFVVGSAYNEQDKEAVIVTAGGKKVRFKEGQDVQKLSEIEVTGINPAAAKRKVIAGAAKK